ncbi:MAG: GNAT family N-acetyltransferase [Candidatus Aenigmatarchaeota archaeon]
MKRMKIRLCKKEDLQQIMKLGKDVFCGESWYRKNVFDSILKENPKTCWVLEVDGKIEGVRFGLADLGGRAWGWILVIDKEMRRKGFGTKLFLYTAKKLKRMGYRKLYADCSTKNQPSIKWHLKMGYNMSGVFRDWYAKGADAIIFDYDL